MAHHKYKNYIQTSYRDEIMNLLAKESNRLDISQQDVIRMAVDQYFQQIEKKPETPNEKTNNGNKQSERNDGKREHLYF
jgi:hypothetical protein